jgi:NAD(P)-dependent dehydrogenase (short-subunit alcohol dehydrogenase family)
VQRWTAQDIPDQTGRHVVVTGATSGLGREVALELARNRADVTLAVRDQDKGRRVADEIVAEIGGVHGRLDVARLDLADLESVRQCADDLLASARGVDVLVNNAGVMAIPRRETVDGFEMQLATNHLGPMALTLRLLPALAETGRVGRSSRVVTVSSGVHRMGRIDLDDLMGERRYQPWRAYGQSKLANLLFTAELQRRLDARSLPVAAYAAHPGYAATNLQSVGPTMRGSRVGAIATEWGNRLFAQSAAAGALPLLYAATVVGLPPGSYAGPDSWFEQRGHPTLVEMSAAAHDEAMAGELWRRSEELIGIRIDDVLPL